MLRRLFIQNIVLIDQLALEFGPGLTVLTGETGSGKSILLGALGLVLGERAEQGLIRAGASQASVAAEFELEDVPGVAGLLEEAGLPVEEMLVVRRQLAADGKSRAFINDMPVTIGVLRDIGAALLEVHGQHESRGLLDARYHRSVLDAYGQLQGQVAEVTRLYHTLRETQAQLAALEAEILRLQKEEEYLRHMVKELHSLQPGAGEEEALSETRRRLMQAEKTVADVRDALEGLSEPHSMLGQIHAVERLLTRVSVPQEGPVAEALAALQQAGESLELATQALETEMRQAAVDPQLLEQTEERLFALRAAARKHHCTVPELAEKYQGFVTQLSLLDGQRLATGHLRKARDEAHAAYRSAAAKLSEKRAKAAVRLRKAIQDELAPLKLGEARFEIQLVPLPENEAGPQGQEHVQFLVATNPGSAPGALGKVASGGELSRLMLACKVALADVEGVPSMVFDEVDTGIGGATADAVGKRLALLGQARQVFVVTHQPQVAALADQHLRVAKQAGKKTTTTTVTALDAAARQEELARMLAGEQITEEARKAAASLLAGRERPAKSKPRVKEPA